MASQRATKRAFLGGLFFFLSDLLFELVDLFFFLFFFFFEVFAVPEIGFMQGAFGRVARVEDDFVHKRFEVSEA